MTPVQSILGSLGLGLPDPQWVRSRIKHPNAELRRFVGLPRLAGMVVGKVYFAQATPGGPVKIGWSTNVRKRVMELARSTPGLSPLADVSGIRLDEGRVHRALDVHRATEPIYSRSEYRGICSISWPEGREWFHPTEDVRRVVEACGGRLK